jgi:hypothetical protein
MPRRTAEAFPLPIQEKPLREADLLIDPREQIRDINKDIANIQNNLAHREEQHGPDIDSLKERISQLIAQRSRLEADIAPDLSFADDLDIDSLVEKTNISDLFEYVTFRKDEEHAREIVGTGKEFIPSPIRHILENLSIEEAVEYVKRLERTNPSKAEAYKDMVHRLLFAVIPTNEGGSQLPDYNDPLYKKIEVLNRKFSAIEAPSLRMQMMYALDTLTYSENFKKETAKLIAEGVLPNNPEDFINFIDSLTSQERSSFEKRHTNIDTIRAFFTSAGSESIPGVEKIEDNGLKTTGEKSKQISDFYKETAVNFNFLKDDTDPVIIPKTFTEKLRTLSLSEQITLLRDNEPRLKFSTISRLFDGILPKLDPKSDEFKNTIKQEYNALSPEDQIFFDYLVRKMLVHEESTEKYKQRAADLLFIIRENDIEVKGLRSDTLPSIEIPIEESDLFDLPNLTQKKEESNKGAVPKDLPAFSRKTPIREKKLPPRDPTVARRTIGRDDTLYTRKAQKGREPTIPNSFDRTVRYETNAFESLLRNTNLSESERKLITEDAKLKEKMDQYRNQKKTLGTKAYMQTVINDRIESLDIIITQQHLQSSFGKKIIRLFRREKTSEELLRSTYDKVLQQIG